MIENRNWKCLLLGHQDPVLDYAVSDLGKLVETLARSKDAHYELWLNYERNCERCGKALRRSAGSI